MRFTSSARSTLQLAAAAAIAGATIMTTACESTGGDSGDTSYLDTGDAGDATVSVPDAAPPTAATITPSPTSTSFGAVRNQLGTDDFFAYACLVDSLDPTAGVTLSSSNCGGSGESLVLGFTMTSPDPALVFVGSSGVFSIASGTAGAAGEGPFPGTSAWRMPTDTSVDFTLSSVVLRQTSWTAGLTLSVASNPRSLTIEEITFTPN